MIALTPNKTWDYILHADRLLPAKERSVFKLKSIEPEIDYVIRDQTTGPYGSNDPGTRERMQLSVGLVGWENVKDASGVKIEFKPGEDGSCHMDNLGHIPWRDRAELARAIQDRSELTEDEAKNLLSAAIS